MFAFVAQIVPCNVRVQFNELTGDSVHFLACGHTYEVKVQKGITTTRLGGAGWRRFVTRNHLTGDEMVCFSLARDTPRITIIYLNTSGEEEDEEEDNKLSPVISQRCKLTEGEKKHLLQIIPPSSSFLVAPFVTRLTKTNVQRRLMVRILFQDPAAIHHYLFFIVFIIYSNDRVFITSS